MEETDVGINVIRRVPWFGFSFQFKQFYTGVNLNKTELLL